MKSADNVLPAGRGQLAGFVCGFFLFQDLPEPFECSCPEYQFLLLRAIVPVHPDPHAGPGGGNGRLVKMNPLRAQGAGLLPDEDSSFEALFILSGMYQQR